MNGKHLKSVRESLKESQARFAARLGVDQTTIHRWEASEVPIVGTARLAVRLLIAQLREQGALPKGEPAE